MFGGAFLFRLCLSHFERLRKNKEYKTKTSFYSFGRALWFHFLLFSARLATVLDGVPLGMYWVMVFRGGGEGESCI